jgi:hypothetical protein
MSLKKQHTLYMIYIAELLSSRGVDACRLLLSLLLLLLLLSLLSLIVARGVVGAEMARCGAGGVCRSRVMCSDGL